MPGIADNVLCMSPARFLRSFLAFALTAGLLTFASSPATALSFRSRPASQWTNYYAGAAAPTARHLGTSKFGDTGWKKATASPTTFIVNYTNFPEAAKVAFNAAVSIWANFYPSTVPIRIDASWLNLGANVLGSTAPGNFYSGFDGAPDQSLWYPSALANALAGKDLNPGSPEIRMKFSSGSFWYYGTDGQVPRGSYDLETAVLHELGHGLGFLSSDTYDTSTGLGVLDQPTPFDAFARTQDDQALVDIASPSLALGQALTSPLTWGGARGIAANNGIRPKLYTPGTYQDGSSVSHLDEASYPSGTPNTLMTPSLNPGEVIHDPGPIALGMFEDLRTKPPVGAVTSLPSAPQNPLALVGDASAIITFTPPVDARITQVTSYAVTVKPGGAGFSAESSPIKITGLKVGVAYTFSIQAVNSLGAGPAAFAGPVVPEPSWKAKVIDRSASPDFVATTSFRKSLTVIYADSVTGVLKRAMLIGTKWHIDVIDGIDTAYGGTTHRLAGALSTCITGSGSKQLLHVFYTDVEDKDLRHAVFDGKRWKHEVIDGDGPVVQDVADPNRTRTKSDVSVSNACAATQDGLQVFYRDDSQGILLGAVQTATGWRYELVDGDRTTDNRTTGDVAFHLAAVAVGRSVHVIYDSVLKIDHDRKATRGEVREAVRTSNRPGDWSYRTIDAASDNYPVSGYGLAVNVVGGQIYGAWLSASSSTLGTPVADTIDWANLSTPYPIPVRVPGGSFGTPSQPLAINGTTLLYGCQGRLCAVNLPTKSQSLVSGKDASTIRNAAFATVARRNGVLAGLNNALMLLEP